MPPRMPAVRTTGVIAHCGAAMPCVVTYSATPPAVIAPSRNWPSAPMFQTFAR